METPSSPWSHPPVKGTPSLLTLGGQDLSDSESVASFTSLDVIEKVEVGPTVKDENQAYNTMQLSNASSSTISSSICSGYSGSSGRSLESSSSSIDMLVEIVPAHAAPTAAADDTGGGSGSRDREFAPLRLSGFFMRFVRSHPQLIHVLAVQLKVSSKTVGWERAEDALREGLREGGAWWSSLPAAVRSALLVGSRHDNPTNHMCIISYLERANAHLV